MSDEQTAVKRPHRYSDEVLALVVDRLLPAVVDWLGEEGSPDGAMPDDAIRGELMESVRYSDDGYKIARSLDIFDPDAELVEILDRTGHYRWEAHAQVVRAWVKSNGITVPFAVGQRVRITVGDKKGECGEITSIDATTAQCVVLCESAGHARHANGSTGAIRFLVAAEELESEVPA